MIKRALEVKLRDAAEHYPVVTLTGPRQSGKTTILRNTFPAYHYVSLEEPDERAFARSDPRGFLSRYKTEVIFDEVQRAPDLFSYIQTNVDENDAPGRFILSGSQNFLLLGSVSQTLAGRTSILHLMPFTKREIENREELTLERLFDDPPETSSTDLFRMVFTGFYPRIHDKNLEPQGWYSDYFQTYIQRDVRDLVQVGDAEVFIRFVRLCAGRVGQLLSLSSLAADCGISHTTARRWLSILESSFIVYRLMPHYKNFSKRLIKSPKLYFLDCGLLCYLLRIKTPEDLQISPFRGAVFESFCISEFLKSAYHRKMEPDLFFWRDSTGHEIDLLIETSGALVPFEIKSGETFNESFLDGLFYWQKLSGVNNDNATVLFGGNRKMKYKGINVIPWSHL